MVLEFKNVWEVCEFEDDVKYGKLEPARFAVKLYDVLEGKADEVYTDPKLFFPHTHLTENMKYLLREALRKLSGKDGHPVFVVDTEFGGGKTPILHPLYYVFKNRDVGASFIWEKRLIEGTGVIESPSVKILGIDCRRIGRNTLWSEIVHSLGRNDIFGDEERSIGPVKDVGKLMSLLEEPPLIFPDEPSLHPSYGI